MFGFGRQTGTQIKGGPHIRSKKLRVTLDFSPIITYTFDRYYYCYLLLHPPPLPSPTIGLSSIVAFGRQIWPQR